MTGSSVLPPGGPPARPRDPGWAFCRQAARIGPTEVAYLSVGDGPRPPMVLIHGLGGSSEAWLANLAHLSRDRRVIALDLPGFGQSPPDPTVITVSSFARLVEGLCIHLGTGPVVMVGSSLGGWVAAETAIRAPWLVDRLVLVDAVGVPPTRPERWRLVAALRTAGLVAPLAGRFKTRLLSRARLRRHLLAFAFARPDLMDPALLARQIPERPSPVFHQVMTAGIRSWSPSWFDRAADITAPTLVVWGAEDRQLPIRHAHRWVANLRDAHLHVIPGAGHLPMLERPDEFNHVVAGFADQADAPGGRVAS